MANKLLYTLSLLVGIFLASLVFPNYTMAEQPIEFNMNKKPVKINTQPYIVNGKMYLPVREFCEALGAEVTWDNSNHDVKVELKNIDTANAGEEIDIKQTQCIKDHDLAKVYNMLINEIYNKDMVLNDGIQYIAVDLTGVTFLTPEEKKQLRNLVERNYKSTVIFATYDDLLKWGHITFIDKEHRMGIFNKGILITVTDKSVGNDTAIISCDKYRSAYAAIGYGDLVLRYWDDNWTITLYKNGSEIGSSTSLPESSNDTMTQPSIHFYLNGKLVKINVDPYMLNEKMYLPVRSFCEALGGNVKWDANSHSINIEIKNLATYKQEEGPNSNYIPCKRAPDIVEAYTMLINELYEIDPALNSDIKYLAIDTSGMSNLTAEQKSQLMTLIRKKYRLVVLNKTEEQLYKEGYIKQINHDGYPFAIFQEGILISIHDKPIENNSITLTCYKYRSALGAIGYYNLEMDYKNGYWFIKIYGIMIAS